MSLGLWPERWDWFGPERTALVDAGTGERWSYRDLHRRSLRRAAWLRDAHGVRPGDRVAWVSRNRPEFFEALFACARLGAILVPVNWRLAPPERRGVLDHAEPRVVLEGDLTGPLAGDGPDPRVETYPAGEATPLVILYTSGTTGRPKGAVLTHGSMTANSLNTTVACDLVADDSTLTYTPLFHTGALNVLSLPLLHRGGRVVLLGAFDATEALRVMEREAITTLFGVPTTYTMLRESPGFATADLGRLRLALVGGAPCPVGLIRDYADRGVVLRQGYGLTEVGPNCFSLPARDALRRAGTVGHPVMHCRARVVDEAGRDVAPGEVGELWLAGPHVCAGYWRDPEATAAASRDGWWATGDLFRVDGEGYYQVVGRRKEMFISGGENVYPAEVEQAILQHPQVRECAVVGVPDPLWGEVGRAYVAPREAATEGLLSFLGQRMARYKVPRSVVGLPELPRNATGKVDRRALVSAAGLV
ncbi:MAG: long-chain fatty acid--CoA ligase [Planctomycetes bacterium]|nr:long-chain fatty acid--CoA ligase [Planctomycetota bacterium]